MMAEIIEIENYIDSRWVRHLHLMSNEPIVEGDFENTNWFVPDDVEVKKTFEAGVHHLRAEWEAREAFAGTLYGSDRRERQIVLWAMKRGERISECVKEAAVVFRRTFVRQPSFAAVRNFPRGVDVDCDIDAGGVNCVALVECKDVLSGFVMLF